MEQECEDTAVMDFGVEERYTGMCDTFSQMSITNI